MIQIPHDFVEFIKLLNENDVEFEECYNQRVTLDVNEVPVNFIDLAHLLTNKLATNRAKDKVDAAELQKRNS